jgi:hypothetical protein
VAVAVAKSEGLHSYIGEKARHSVLFNCITVVWPVAGTLYLGLATILRA